MGKKIRQQISSRADPLEKTRADLISDMERLQALEENVTQEIVKVVELALKPEGSKV
jgi:hypothetical protein